MQKIKKNIKLICNPGTGLKITTVIIMVNLSATFLLEQGLASFFGIGPDNKYFKLYRQLPTSG